MVSICIPTYNQLELFKRCLSSVLMQDFSDYEIIVSDDSTNEEIKNYVADLKLRNLVYLHNSPALGAPANWNNCLRRATRKYIKILHHDDYFATKNALAKFVYSLENNPGASFSFCYSHIHFKKSNTFFIHRQTSMQLKRLKAPVFLFYRNVIGSPSATFFKNDAQLFNEHYKWLVDVEFYIRYLKKHQDFVAIPEALITVTDGESGQITQSVAGDKQLVIGEHIRLFEALYSKKLDLKKSYLFFQDLFVQFGIDSYPQLISEFDIPRTLQPFMKVTFKDLKKNTLFKKIKKRLLTSRYNKLIFKIERF